MFNVKIKLLDGGVLPEWHDMGDAGLDLRSAVDMVIESSGAGLIPLGFCTEFAPQYVALIKDRSGLALKGVYTHGGVIDSSYRGEWKVIVENTSKANWHIYKGDRIAQAIFIPCFHLIITRADKLSDSWRGIGGFGSTGSA